MTTAHTTLTIVAEVVTTLQPHLRLHHQDPFNIKLAGRHKTLIIRIVKVEQILVGNVYNNSFYLCLMPKY